jgi:general secretion pathway protein F
MATFEYVAIDAQGRRTRGVVAADTPRAARREIQRRKLSPVRLTPAAERRGTGLLSVRLHPARIATGDLVLITRQLALLVGSGAPAAEALASVAAQTTRPSAARVLHAVRAQVTEGRRLSEAFAQHGGVGPLYVGAIAAGEASGTLGPVLERLAAHLEKSQAMRRKAVAALVYPAVLAVVALGVIAALMAFVVPRIVGQFSTMGADLPLLTRILIGASDGVRDWGLPLVLAFGAGAILLARALRHAAFRRRVDGALLRLPVLGRLARIAAAAGFARTFATLTGSGAPVLEALSAARASAGNLALQDAIEAAARDVREGAALSAALRRTGAFPPLLVHMAASGEQSGALAAMFAKSADYLENEFETATGVALNLLEPLVVVVMGGAVAAIVLAVMLPILQLNTAALF